ncbi:MAG: hypothetical protein WCL00_11710 [Bacteroidota bacterium]
MTASRKPSVKFNGVMMYAPIIHDYGYSQAITNNGNFFSTVSVSQNIFNTKTVEAQYAKIGFENQSIRNVLQISKRDLKKSITDQYLITFNDSHHLIFSGRKTGDHTREDEKYQKDFRSDSYLYWHAYLMGIADAMRKL